jgi:predicted small secreted protein
MKILLLLAVVFSLVSCNTSIGLWRDTKAVVKWSADKIAGTGDGGGGDEYDTEYGAPVY